MYDKIADGVFAFYICLGKVREKSAPDGLPPGTQLQDTRPTQKDISS